MTDNEIADSIPTPEEAEAIALREGVNIDEVLRRVYLRTAIQLGEAFQEAMRDRDSLRASLVDVAKRLDSILSAGVLRIAADSEERLCIQLDAEEANGACDALEYAARLLDATRKPAA